MLRVYEVCIRIRGISKQQLSLSDDMALIAINAEIAAAKSTLNQEAFMVLASETGKIAHNMSAHVVRILDQADKLARDALRGVVNSRRLDKLTLGLGRVQQPQNAQVVQGVAADLDDGLIQLMAGIVATQQDVEVIRQALAKQSQRVARIITYFRIEASRDADHGSFFRNIAEDLNSLISLADTISHELQEVLKGKPPIPTR
jgi:hypothetical protein